jgi:hypothetical protein
MSGVRQGDGAVRFDAERKAGGMSFAASEEPPVERIKDESRVGIAFRRAPYRPD